MLNHNLTKPRSGRAKQNKRAARQGLKTVERFSRSFLFPSLHFFRTSQSASIQLHHILYEPTHTHFNYAFPCRFHRPRSFFFGRCPIPPGLRSVSALRCTVVLLLGTRTHHFTASSYLLTSFPCTAPGGGPDATQCEQTALEANYQGTPGQPGYDVDGYKSDQPIPVAGTNPVQCVQVSTTRYNPAGYFCGESLNDENVIVALSNHSKLTCVFALV